MNSVLVLGFFIGLRHALEADHIAAVASLAADGRGAARTAGLGVAWGLGHTLSLLAVGTVALFTGQAVPAQWSVAFESAVGVMLLLLGADLLRRTLGCQSSIVESAEHAPAETTAPRPKQGLHRRAVFIGIVHGLAGSAALVLLTASTIQSPASGVLYLSVFSAGAIGGMALLSLLMALPARYLAPRAEKALRVVSMLVGLLTAALGLRIFMENAGHFWT